MTTTSPSTRDSTARAGASKPAVQSSLKGIASRRDEEGAADNVVPIRGPRHIGDIANEIVERARQKMLENRRRGE